MWHEETATINPTLIDTSSLATSARKSGHGDTGSPADWRIADRAAAPAGSPAAGTAAEIKKSHWHPFINREYPKLKLDSSLRIIPLIFIFFALVIAIEKHNFQLLLSLSRELLVMNPIQNMLKTHQNHCGSSRSGCAPQPLRSAFTAIEFICERFGSKCSTKQRKSRENVHSEMSREAPVRITREDGGRRHTVSLSVEALIQYRLPLSYFKASSSVRKAAISLIGNSVGYDLPLYQIGEFHS